MNDHRKPRHIRDIAHLYISRLPARIDRHRVWVTAISRDCFSAYHAANLALGMAHRGHVVELVEASGVLPCTAYFLRLPPRVYIKHKAQCPEESLSALGGIKLKFSAETDEAIRDIGTTGSVSGGQSLSQSYGSSRDASQPLSQSYGSSRDASPASSASQPRKSKKQVELIHLPPASDLESLQATMSRFRRITGDDRIRALVLADDDTQAQEVGHRVFGADPGVQWSTLALERHASMGGRLGNGGRNLGYLVGWRQLLSDTVPCVLRDPDSHVSRSYLSIGDELISAGINAKERNDRNSRIRSASLGRSG